MNRLDFTAFPFNLCYNKHQNTTNYILKMIDSVSQHYKLKMNCGKEINMEKRILGKTELEVSSLSLGTMDLRYLDEESAGKLLNKALDLGITYIDSSPEYPMAEYFIGKTIAHRRNEFVLATKCGDNMTGVGPLYLFDRKTIMDNLDKSLQLMKTDHIDVWQLHGVVPHFFPDGEFGEAMEAMRDAKKAGKVLHTGLSIRNGGPTDYGFPGTFSYGSVPVFSAWQDIEVIQVVYGALTRTCEDVIQKAYDEHKTGIVSRGALKKYTENYDSRFEFSKISELFEEEETRNEFLIRFAFTHPAVASVVIGTKNIEHLVEDVKMTARGKLSEEIYNEAKKRLDYVGAIAGKAW